jgi:L-seryl-tRNA(Ser) seleniumtransferase
VTDHGATQRSSLAGLPSVDRVLRDATAVPLLERHGHRRVVAAVRTALEHARDEVRRGGVAPDAPTILAAAQRELERAHEGDIRAVVNATGVVLHTNLGRAPLSAAARRAVDAAAGYASVEFDLATGARGSRTAHLGELAAALCGTEAALVVNNGAAALLLAMAALAPGQGVVVSRGELIEIGGSFRLPDLITASGARLVEVGTANRTRYADYVTGLDAGGALLLKVHRANFRLVGFTEETPLSELRELADARAVPLVYDLGSGAIRRAMTGPLVEEPTVEAAVAAGADVVVFSGDKLLGGPQAGVLAGGADVIERCARHPIARAVRVDKLQRAAMEATLHAHLVDDTPGSIPTVAMLHRPVEELRRRADAVLAEVAAITGRIEVVDLDGAVGGGALPGVTLPSAGLAWAAPDPDSVVRQLRASDPPIVARIEDGRVVLDLRTVDPREDALVARALLAVSAGAAVPGRDHGDPGPDPGDDARSRRTS